MEEELSLLAVLCCRKKKIHSKCSCVAQGAFSFHPFIISWLYLIFSTAYELVFMNSSKRWLILEDFR